MMKASNIKGALLEYTVRKILTNCGFTNVKADDIYTFENQGLFFINGKGAAHDADILVEPPIQMPFTYPTRLIFECKAYKSDISLPVVRNAVGLRNDINEFEIVTKESIEKRKNNRRAEYAIEKRNRYIFQVGVASINDFSKPSYEFAANNKIPLFSLSWFLSETMIGKINSITDDYIEELDQEKVDNLYSFLKDRNGNIMNYEYKPAHLLLESDSLISDIISFTGALIDLVFVAVLETGDLLFLYPSTENGSERFRNMLRFTGLKAEIHYYAGRENIWTLTVHPEDNNNAVTEFQFYLPKTILEYWQRYDLDKREAWKIKQRFFSKIFVFNGTNNSKLPFAIVELNESWLDNIIAEDNS